MHFVNRRSCAKDSVLIETSESIVSLQCLCHIYSDPSFFYISLYVKAFSHFLFKTMFFFQVHMKLTKPTLNTSPFFYSFVHKSENGFKSELSEFISTKTGMFIDKYYIYNE